MFYRSIHGNIMNITLLLSLTFRAPFFSPTGKKWGRVDSCFPDLS